jgi:sulfur-oxidizing protein SoxY
MTTRRHALARSLRLAALLAGAGLLPRVASAWNARAFEAKGFAETLKSLGPGTPAESKEVVLMGPEIADDGSVVQLEVSTSAPGARRLAVLIEKNPFTLAAVYELSDAIEPAFTMRVKMAESSNVYAVAMLADGRVLYARRNIRVTLGGCGA